MKRKHPINFMYAVLIITVISSVCTFFIVRTTRAVTEKIESNRTQTTLILQGA